MDLFLSLVTLKPKEPDSTWEDFCNDPMKLFTEFAKRYVVDANILKPSVAVIKSDIVPEPKDRGKLWVKTSWPYGIGVVIDGQYEMDWGLSGFPVNTPFLYKASEVETPTPDGLHKLTPDEITNYGLTDTTGSHEDKLNWFIFEPDDIVV